MPARAWLRSLRLRLGLKPVNRIPDNHVSLSLEQLNAVWPFHIVIRDGRAGQIGPGLGKCLDDREPVGFPMQELLVITAPDGLDEPNWQQPHALLDRPLELCTPSGLSFSGELQGLPSDRWLLILQPIAHSIRDLHHYGLTLQDLSLGDPLRQHVLPSLLNEGLQEMLLQEATTPKEELGEEAIERAWIDLGLETGA